MKTLMDAFFSCAAHIADPQGANVFAIAPGFA